MMILNIYTMSYFLNKSKPTAKNLLRLSAFLYLSQETEERLGAGYLLFGEMAVEEE